MNQTECLKYCKQVVSEGFADDIRTARNVRDIIVPNARKAIANIQDASDVLATLKWAQEKMAEN